MFLIGNILLLTSELCLVLERVALTTFVKPPIAKIYEYAEIIYNCGRVIINIYQMPLTFDYVEPPIATGPILHGNNRRKPIPRINLCSRHVEDRSLSVT